MLSCGFAVGFDSVSWVWIWIALVGLCLVCVLSFWFGFELVLFTMFVAGGEVVLVG